MNRVNKHCALRLWDLWNNKDVSQSLIILALTLFVSSIKEILGGVASKIKTETMWGACKKIGGTHFVD